MVVREHFQEVMNLINDKSSADGAVDGKSTFSGDKQRAEHFDELTAANSELRQEAFMDLYFFKVLRQVRERAVISYARRQTAYAPWVYSREPSIGSLREAKPPMSASAPPSATPSRPISPGPPTPQLNKHESSNSVPVVQIQSPIRASLQYLDLDLSARPEAEASAIWCTLVLRMLCWLLLHDFEKNDVQIPKSELLASRFPVYIA
jgi:hypothetical protein